MRSAPDQVSFPFNVNEHVWCLMDENCEYGVIGGAIYDEQNKPSGAAAGKLRIAFADNSTIEYDRNSHILSLDIKDKVDIKCNEANLTCLTEFNVTAPQTNFTGIVNISGAATIRGIAAVGGISGVDGADIPGTDAVLNLKKVTATDDVTAAGIGLKTHKHISASPGNPTGPPTP
jgi:phage baseplate assembly protein V